MINWELRYKRTMIVVIVVLALMLAVAFSLFVDSLRIHEDKQIPHGHNLYVYTVTLSDGHYVDCVVNGSAIDCDFLHRAYRAQAIFETTPIPTPDDHDGGETSGPE